MKNFIFNKCTIAVLTIATSLTSCSSDNDPVTDNHNDDITSAYIFTGTNSEGTIIFQQWHH